MIMLFTPAPPQRNDSIPLLLAGLWWDHPEPHTRTVALSRCAERRRPTAFKAPLKTDCAVSQLDSWIPLKTTHTHTCTGPAEVKQSLASDSALVINSLSLQGLKSGETWVPSMTKCFCFTCRPLARKWETAFRWCVIEKQEVGVK